MSNAQKVSPLDADRAMHQIWAEWFAFYDKHFRGPGIAISAADQMAFYEIAQPIIQALRAAPTPDAHSEAGDLSDDIAEILFNQRQTNHVWNDAIEADAESDAGTLVSICRDDAEAVLSHCLVGAVKQWKANDELRKLCARLAAAIQHPNGGATLPPVAVCHEAAFLLNSLCRERDFLSEHVKNEARRADDNLDRAVDAETKLRTAAASLDRHSTALINSQFLIADLQNTLRVFVRHYDPWMEKHGEHTEVSSFSRHTFGELRHAKKLAEHPILPPVSQADVYGVYLTRDGRFMDIASSSRDDAIEMAEAHYDVSQYVVRPLYAALTAGVVKDLNEVISSKTREIEPLMPAVTYRTGGIYVAEVKRLIAKAKEQQSALVGGPEGDSILGYTIPTGTWLMLQANIGALIEALTAGAGKAEPVDITDEMVERAIVGYVDALQDVSARLAFSDLATHDRIGMRAALYAALASKPEGEL